MVDCWWMANSLPWLFGSGLAKNRLGLKCGPPKSINKGNAKQH